MIIRTMNKGIRNGVVALITRLAETFETFDKFQEFYYLNRKKMLSSIKKDMVNKDFEEV